MSDTQTVMIGPGELFVKSWKFFKQRWQVLVLVSLVPIAIIAIAGVLVAILGFAGVASLAAFSSENNSAAAISGGSLLFILLFVFLYIGFIVMMLWSQMAVLTVVSHPEESIGVSKAYSLAKGKLWPYFVTAFVVGLLTYFGTFVFIIPGLVLSFWFLLYPYVVINEGSVGLNAALTSRGLMRGREWGVLGRLLVLGLVFFGSLILFFALFFTLIDNKEAGLVVFLLFCVMFLYFISLNFIAASYAYWQYKNLRDLHPEPVTIAAGTRKKYILFGILGFILCVVFYIIQFAFALQTAIKMKDTLPSGIDLNNEQTVPSESEPDVYEPDTFENDTSNDSMESI